MNGITINRSIVNMTIIGVVFLFLGIISVHFDLPPYLDFTFLFVSFIFLLASVMYNKADVLAKALLLMALGGFWGYGIQGEIVPRFTLLTEGNNPFLDFISFIAKYGAVAAAGSLLAVDSAEYSKQGNINIDKEIQSDNSFIYNELRKLNAKTDKVNNRFYALLILYFVTLLVFFSIWSYIK